MCQKHLHVFPRTGWILLYFTFHLLFAQVAGLTAPQASSAHLAQEDLFLLLLLDHLGAQPILAIMQLILLHHHPLQQQALPSLLLRNGPSTHSGKCYPTRVSNSPGGIQKRNFTICLSALTKTLRVLPAPQKFQNKQQHDPYGSPPTRLSFSPQQLPRLPLIPAGSLSWPHTIVPRPLRP